MKHLTWALAVGVAAASCSTHQKAEVTEAAMDDRGRRRELLEATLRVLDDNPAYVDELFALAQRHPRTLDRMFANTARGVAERDLAERVARQLVAHPRGLRMMMVTTIDAAKSRPKARAAIVDAMAARADAAADILVAEPEELAVIFEAIVRAAWDDPDTKGTVKDVVAELVD